MELVTILRELWRLRLLVLGIALLALLVGLALAFRVPSLESRKYEVGVATASVLVDTPNSQFIEVAPKGSDTLAMRANLLANLMAEGVVKSAIAERAGIPPDELHGISQSTGPGAEAAAEAPPAGAHVLVTRVVGTPGGDQLPIIQIEAQAPDATRAAKLAEAAVSGLTDYLDSKAADERVADADRLRVSGLGPPQARQVVRGPRGLFAFVAVIFVFAVGCGALLIGLAVVRGWRIASEIDEQRVFEHEDEAELAMLADPFDDLAGEPEHASDPSMRRQYAMTPPDDLDGLADDDSKRG
jgi:hypothetical protein